MGNLVEQNLREKVKAFNLKLALDRQLGLISIEFGLLGVDRTIASLSKRGLELIENLNESAADTQVASKDEEKER